MLRHLQGLRRPKPSNCTTSMDEVVFLCSNCPRSEKEGEPILRMGSLAFSEKGVLPNLTLYGLTTEHCDAHHSVDLVLRRRFGRGGFRVSHYPRQCKTRRAYFRSENLQHLRLYVSFPRLARREQAAVPPARKAWCSGNLRVGVCWREKWFNLPCAHRKGKNRCELSLSYSRTTCWGFLSVLRPVNLMCRTWFVSVILAVFFHRLFTRGT